MAGVYLGLSLTLLFNYLKLRTVSLNKGKYIEVVNIGLFINRATSRLKFSREKKSSGK